MLIDLHSIAISLKSRDERVSERWRHLFDFELSCRSYYSQDTVPDIVLEAKLENSLPPLPSSSPFYVSSDPLLEVYSVQDQQLLLRLSNTGHIQLQLPRNVSNRNSETAYARIVLTEPSLHIGNLEDITSLALAPILRRRGLFLIHAFAAARNQKAVMFVGPSGSGKTSSGLALVASGWQFLANDLALMRQPDAPLALLSPGTIQITPATFSLLPQYTEHSRKYPRNSVQTKASVPRLEFIHTDEATLSAPIRTIFFPFIGKTNTHSTVMVPRAVGLARLMESSMDQWDQEIWEEHIGFLESLSHKVEFYELSLGPDMANLPEYLENVVTG